MRLFATSGFVLTSEIRKEQSGYFEAPWSYPGTPHPSMLNNTDGRHPDFWFFLDGQGDFPVNITLLCRGEVGRYGGSLIEWPWWGGDSGPNYHVNGSLVSDGWQLLKGLCIYRTTG